MDRAGISLCTAEYSHMDREQTFMSTVIKLNKDDVSIWPLETKRCEHCNEPATHTVQLDLRSAGSAHEIFRGCWDCCLEFSKRVKEGL